MYGYFKTTLKRSRGKLVSCLGCSAHKSACGHQRGSTRSLTFGLGLLSHHSERCTCSHITVNYNFNARVQAIWSVIFVIVTEKKPNTTNKYYFGIFIKLFMNVKISEEDHKNDIHIRVRCCRKLLTMQQWNSNTKWLLYNWKSTRPLSRLVSCTPFSTKTF